MKTRLFNIWDAIHSSFWFVPTLMAIAAVLLALLALWLDERLDFADYKGVIGIYRGGADGAQTLLSTVAASMITVTGVTFSITIVALQLASSQFGPRLLRNFMQDIGNQLVLGTFLATFLYCIIILQAVSGEEETFFVPRFSITLAMILTVASLGVLIYFIHHAAASIQAENVVADIADDLENGIDRLYPGRLGEAREPRRDAEHAVLLNRVQAAGKRIDSRRTGYIRTIDGEKLIEIAEEHDLILELRLRPGHYVLEGTTIFVVSPAENATPAVQNQLLDLIDYGRQRTGFQDVEFSVNQLVEIAVRALSKGINDPFTAIACVDRLGAVLAKLAGREIPSPFRTDKQGRLRAVTNATNFVGVLDASFNQIRQNAGDAPAVLIRILDRLDDLARHVRRADDRAAVLRHAVLIHEQSKKADLLEPDLKEIERRYQIILQAFAEDFANA